MTLLKLLLLLVITTNSYALTWQDLWITKDQQGEKLMQRGQFKKAQTVFTEPAWRASAAYRAGDYQSAAQMFNSLKTPESFYNQGNALAHLGKYEEAIKAYNKALAINPNNKDALYNRRLLEDLLKKQKEKQTNSEQNKQQESNGQNDQQSKQKQQSSSNNNKQQNGQQKDSEPKQQNNQNNNSDNQQANKQNKQQNSSTDQKNNEAEKQQTENQENRQNQKDNQQQAKQNQQKPDNQQVASQSSQEQEKEQAKEQWLRLIPDDPGGLLREKFLRDYIRRQQGWYQ
ncbi:tetratricopeptide repeat protein [Legionella sp. D16C41]|uniref:tetratricopeptide repeat protein n=1 Tax=Legionella sp. D16C41 TaxID=3402688 RepID=UPI003AF8913D